MANPLRLLTRLASLGEGRSALAAEAAMLLAVAQVFANRRGLEATQRAMRRWAPPLRRAVPGRQAAVRAAVGWAVERAATHLGRGRHLTCLPRAMAAQAMLARRGIAAALCIGVRPAVQGEGIEAHAWVESGGRIVVGAPITGFSQLHGPGNLAGARWS